MKAMQRHLAIFAIPMACVVGLCLLLLITGAVTPFISGFAVDKNDRIYVGEETEICVYENNVLIRTINPQTSRAYAFTIADDRILLSTASTFYTMDLDGNILDTQEDPGAHMYNQLQYNKRKYISHSGDTYKLKSQMGWTRIVKNDTQTVYQISPLSFVVKILLALSVLAMFIFPLWMLKRHPKPSLGGRWRGERRAG